MSHVRPTPNEFAARSWDGYRGRRDESSSRPDNSRTKGNPRDADPDETLKCGICSWINWDEQEYCKRSTCMLRKGSASRGHAAGLQNKRKVL